MITKETIKTVVEEWLSKGDYFLVDIQMDGQDDRIVIEIDCTDGVWIEDCAELSRYMQEKLGDELGDYELEVTGPAVQGGAAIREPRGRRGGGGDSRRPEADRRAESRRRPSVYRYHTGETGARRKETPREGGRRPPVLHGRGEEHPLSSQFQIR